MPEPKPFYVLTNPIKNYAWGSPTILPTLLNYINHKQEPQAELWMGTHPSAPSMVTTANGLESLDTLIKSNPIYFLGEQSIHRYGEQLPFLYKVLAINAPLSLQVHPNKQQAEAGFLCENTLGIALDDPMRSYQDDNHKTELICAYSDDVWALCGFLPCETIIDNFKLVPHPLLNPLLHSLTNNPTPQGLKTFLKALLHLTKEEAHDILQTAQKNTKKDDSSVHYWLSHLIERYPNDLASLAPLYMNVVQIPKGKALFVENGILHAYLQGTGVEIMALSDNVLRFGLTPKYVDISSLEEVVRFESTCVHFLDPDPDLGTFQTPCQEFELAYHQVSEQNPHQLQAKNHAQIMLCVKGSLTIEVYGQYIQSLKQGESIFIPYHAGDYSFSGDGEIFVASTPN